MIHGCVCLIDSPPFVSAGHEIEVDESERDVTFLSL